MQASNYAETLFLARGLFMSAPEVIVVEDHRVACDGGNGALGHPRVFLEMGDEHHIDCPYCGRRYQLSKAAMKAAH